MSSRVMSSLTLTRRTTFKSQDTFRSECPHYVILHFLALVFWSLKDENDWSIIWRKTTTRVETDAIQYSSVTRRARTLISSSFNKHKKEYLFLLISRYFYFINCLTSCIPNNVINRLTSTCVSNHRWSFSVLPLTLFMFFI